MVEILVMLERSRFAKRIVAPITHHRFSMECLHPDRTVCPFWCHSNGKQDCAAFRLSSPLISPEISSNTALVRQGGNYILGIWLSVIASARSLGAIWVSTCSVGGFERWPLP